MSSNKHITRNIITHGIMIAFSLICIIPFILLITTSFTDEDTLIQLGYAFFPKKWSIDAYAYLQLQAGLILNAYKITIVTTVIGTFVSILITALYAYPISRRDFSHRSFFTFIVFLTMLFNGGLVPTYLVYTQIFHIKNTLLALMVPRLLMSGFSVLIMKSYFSINIPDAVIESARIDGAKEIKIFTNIIIPMSVPIFAVIGIMSCTGYWNEWNNGLIYVTDSRLYTIQNLLNRIMRDISFVLSNNDMNTQTSRIPQSGVRMAIAVVGAVPLLLVFPFFQKYFIKGINIGAVKG